MERKISATAFNVFNEVRLDGEHTDVVIRVSGVDFKAHKIILCGCSPYFRVLFSGHWTRAIKHYYNVPGVSPDIMNLIIQYAYTRSAPITEENVTELLEAADQFLVSGLVDACCQFLEEHLCPENCIGIRMFAEHFYSCINLQRKAKHYILQHFEEVARESEEFLGLSLEHLDEIIGQDELNVKQEDVVFEAVIRWIDHSPEDRKKHLAMLLPRVRMGLMSTDYFMSNVKINPLVIGNEECSPLIINVMKVLFDLSLDGASGSDLRNPLTRPRLPSEILLAIGGWSGGNPTNGIEAYDVRADHWLNVTQEEESPRAYHSAVFLDGFVYCIGGFDSVNYFNSVRKFDLIAQTWHEAAPMHKQRCYVSVAALDGYLYAMGGFDGHVRLNTAERYNPKSNQWTLIEPMNEQRSDASATSLQGKVYICGGFTGTDCLFSAESFNPQTHQWSLITPMRSRRSGVGVIAYGDLVYAVGGFDGVSRLESAEAYNPLTDSWHEVPSMFNPRSNFGIEVVDDLLFAVGGFNGLGTTSNVEYYDMKTDEWCDARDMDILRSALSCCVASGLPDVTQYVIKRDLIQTQDESESESSALSGARSV